MNKDWLRSFRSVSFATVLSRLSGYFRDGALGLWIGPGALLDAYFLVTRIASLGRAFFAEGMVNALVPMLSQEPDTQRQYQLLAVCALRVVSVVGLLCVCVSVYPERVLMWLTPGFAGDVRMTYASSLLSLIFWYLLLVSMLSMWNALLHLQGRFFVAAVLPVILNLAIALAAFGMGVLRWPYQSLGYAVLGAGVLQCAVVLAMLWSYLPQGHVCLLSHPRMGALYKAVLGAFASTGAVQCSSLVDAVLASALKVGSVSWLYYADRLIQLPLGVLGAAMMTVLLPKLARHHAGGELADYEETFCLGVEHLLMLGIPVMLFFLCFSDALVAALFGYGKFTPADIIATAVCVRWMALALPAILLAKLLAASSFARQHFSGLVKASTAGVCVNALIAWSLRDAWAQQAMAIAMVAGAWTHVTILYRAASPVSLKRMWVMCRMRRWLACWGTLLLVLGLSASMLPSVEGVWWLRLVTLGYASIPGGCVYGGLLYLMYRSSQAWSLPEPQPQATAAPGASRPN